MDLMFASGTPHLPQVMGGLEINTHQIALELNSRGYKTSVLSKLSLRDLFGASRFLASKACLMDVSVDRSLGYDVYRSLKPWRDIRGLRMPNVVIVQNGNMIQIGRTFRDKGIAAIAYLHGLEFDTGPRAWKETGSELPFFAYIANSAYTAARFQARFGHAATVIPPIFRPELYRTAGLGSHVTFVNPVPVKGVELALAIAELCPEIPFLFVRGWPTGTAAENRLRQEVAKRRNIRLVERSDDMRRIYEQTRLLLVPSQWDETWGRVVSEAHFSGIPVLASDCGGLPEAVGPGGKLLDRSDAPEVWAESLRELWADKDLYEAKRQGALAHGRRPELDVANQIAQLVSIAERALARARPSAPLQEATRQ